MGAVVTEFRQVISAELAAAQRVPEDAELDALVANLRLIGEAIVDDLADDEDPTVAAKWAATDRAAAEAITALRRRVAELTATKDGAYEERNRVVALLARLYPSRVTKTAIEGWSDDWHGCVRIDTPEGQLSWHFHDSQAGLFDGLPKGDMEYDGHTTAEKYERVERLCDAIDAAIAKEPQDA